MKRKTNHRILAVLFIPLLFLVACGSGTPEIGSIGLPQVINKGGTLNTNPVLTAITYPNDALVDSIESFVSKLGSSAYWSSTVGEYGINAAIAAKPVHLTEMPPQAVADADIQNCVISKLDGTHPEFGTPTSNSNYIIYYPVGTAITLQGQASCAVFGGYHNSIVLPNGTVVTYTVVARCGTQGLVDQLTRVTSHEVVEASTDPNPFGTHGTPGYTGLPIAELIWQTVSHGSELADMCQDYSDSLITPTDLGFLVQKVWSNKAAAARTNPCGPNDPGSVYFNALPVVSDLVGYVDTGNSEVSFGVEIPIGQSKTIELDLFSNGPISGAWQLSAVEIPQTNSDLAFSFDKTSGVNGDKVHLTIQVNSQNPTYQAEVFWVVSTLNGVSHYWPVVVGNGP